MIEQLVHYTAILLGLGCVAFSIIFTFGAHKKLIEAWLLLPIIFIGALQASNSIVTASLKLISWLLRATL